MSNEITQEFLKSILEYDPESGLFTWKVTMGPKNVGEIAGGSRKDGYWRIGINGVRHRLHTLAWIYVYGEMPTFAIDHIDGNPSNNRISNLRHVTNSENQRNRRMQSNNSSGATGVSRSKKANKWRAHAKINGKFFSLGLHNSVDSANKAVTEFRIKNGFTERHGCADSVACPRHNRTDG